MWDRFTKTDYKYCEKKNTTKPWDFRTATHLFWNMVFSKLASHPRDDRSLEKSNWQIPTGTLVPRTCRAIIRQTQCHRDPRR